MSVRREERLGRVEEQENLKWEADGDGGHVSLPE